MCECSRHARRTKRVSKVRKPLETHDTAGQKAQGGHGRTQRHKRRTTHTLASTSSSSESKWLSSVSETPSFASVMYARAARTSAGPWSFCRRSNRSVMRSRTAGLMPKGMPSYDAHGATDCATIVSQSGVPAASASVRLSKASRTCCRCTSVSVRPLSCSRCMSTVSGSEMVSTSTMWLAALSPSLPLRIERHLNCPL